jgi:effector-binding domain-containing protein
MKVLKILGIIVLSLLGLWIVLAAVAPSELQVEKSITIEAPASVVFANVNCLDAWPAWSAWQAMDPSMKNEYAENPCGVGAWNSWNGEQSGIGKQTISEVRDNEYIKMDLVFEGFEGTNYSEWKFEETDGSTSVTWNFLGAPSPFFFRPMNMMMKGVLEDSYDQGLAALKAVAEATPAVEQSAYEIVEVDLPAAKYLVVSGDVNPADIEEFYTENFGKIMAHMGKNKVEMAGHPTGLFYSWADTLAKMSAAIPVAADVAGSKEIEFLAIEAGSGLQIDYYGAYDKSEAAHYAMDDYLNANGLAISGAVREVYVTDPTAESDTSKWLTQIIYPVSAAE